MFFSIISFVMFIYNIIKLYSNIYYGVYISLLFSFIAPTLHLGGIIIKYEILIFIPLFFSVVIYTKKLSLANSYVFLSILFFVTLFSTLLNTFEYKGNIEIYSLAGMMRYTLLFLCINSIKLNSTYFNKIITIVVSLNFIAIVYQFINPHDIGIFLDMYGSLSTGSLRGAVTAGVMNRCYGIFTNIAPEGTFLSFATLYYIHNFFVKNNTMSYVFMLISISSGILSASRLYYIVTFLSCILFYIIFFKKLTMIKNLLFIFNLIIIPIIIYSAVYIIQNNDLIFYLNKAIFGGYSNFDSRYASTGILYGMLNTFYENFYLGVGFVEIDRVFVGDSTWIETLYRSGVIGFLTLILFFIFILYRLIISKSYDAVIFISILIIAYTSTSILYSSISVLILALINSDQYNSSN